MIVAACVDALRHKATAAVSGANLFTRIEDLLVIADIVVSHYKCTESDEAFSPDDPLEASAQAMFRALRCARTRDCVGAAANIARLLCSLPNGHGIW
jgi:hypothetical protein